MENKAQVACCVVTNRTGPSWSAVHDLPHLQSNYFCQSIFCLSYMFVQYGCKAIQAEYLFAGLWLRVETDLCSKSCRRHSTRSECSSSATGEQSICITSQTSQTTTQSHRGDCCSGGDHCTTKAIVSCSELRPIKTMPHCLSIRQTRWQRLQAPNGSIWIGIVPSTVPLDVAVL